MAAMAVSFASNKLAIIDLKMISRNADTASTVNNMATMAIQLLNASEAFWVRLDQNRNPSAIIAQELVVHDITMTWMAPKGSTITDQRKQNYVQIR